MASSGRESETLTGNEWSFAPAWAPKGNQACQARENKRTVHHLQTRGIGKHHGIQQKHHNFYYHAVPDPGGPQIHCPNQ